MKNEKSFIQVSSKDSEVGEDIKMRGRASWAFAYALFPMTATTLKNIWNELSIFRVKKVNFWKNERIGSIALLANHGKLIQKFFWNFHFPGRHTDRFTGKLIHSIVLTETIYDT